MFKRLYHWTLSLREPTGAWALGGDCLRRKLIFPVPPDIVLVPMSLAMPKRAWTYAAICTLASVTGGMLGYAIGALL